MTRIFAISAVALAMATTSASAVTLSSVDVILKAPMATTTNGELVKAPDFTDGVVQLNIVGNDPLTPKAKSPYDGTAFVDTALYHSVSAGATAEYYFADGETVFGFMWGSPDGAIRDYNELRFFYKGAEVGFFTGNDLIPPAPSASGFANVLFTGMFDLVQFKSIDIDAFEFTNVVTEVPVPAAGLLLIGALGGLAALRRKV